MMHNTLIPILYWFKIGYATWLFLHRIKIPDIYEPGPSKPLQSVEMAPDQIAERFDCKKMRYDHSCDWYILKYASKLEAEQKTNLAPD